MPATPAGRIETCSWSVFADRILDPRLRLRLHREFLGLLHRPQGYASETWGRGRDMHSLILVDHGTVQVGRSPTRIVGPAMALLSAPHSGTPVRFSPGSRFHEIWLSLDRPGTRIHADPPLRIVDGVGHLVWLFERAALEVLGIAGDDDPVVRRICSLLIALIDRQPPARGQVTPLTAEQRSKIIHWTRAHLAHHPEPADLARIVGLSADYFTRVFRAAFGMPPRRWLVVERIRASARQLQETRAPISAIAESHGFVDPSHFGRIFRSVVGCSPAAWRRRSAAETGGE